jgi:heavy metal sensor kinase
MSFVHTIKFRFTVWYLLVLALLLAGLGIGAYLYLSRSLHSSLDKSLVLRMEQLRNVREVIETIWQGSFEERLGEVVVLFYERDGVVYAMSPREVGIALDEETVRGALDGKSSFETIQVDAIGEMRFHVVPFGQGGAISLSPRQGMGMPGISVKSAALAVGRSTGDIEQALDGLIRTLLIAVPLTLLVAGAGGVFLARRALKPVDDIAKTARQIGETDLTQRIAVSSRDELGRLAFTLNQMIGRLEKAFNRQREFTGDASHELRTPLSVIQAESTLALRRVRSPEDYRASLESIAEESGHMSSLIDQLLILARADSDTEQLFLDEVELNGLLREVGADAGLLLRNRGLELELQLNDSLVVRADKGLLRRLFLNLVDNAVRYTPEGGRVSIATAVRDHTALVSVSDTGIGIAPEHLPRIFDRFYRVDKARSRAEGGSGLGLAICKHIVEVHEGRIEVDSQEGRGTTFHVSLPLLGNG